MKKDEPFYLAHLRTIAPSVAITVSREIDEHELWDGEGPDPREDGYQPYCVDVTSRIILDGEIVEARESLCSSYYLDDEPIGEAHGYLPQMLQESLKRLRSDNDDVAFPAYILKELGEANIYLKRVMRESYEKQRAEFAAQKKEEE